MLANHIRNLLIFFASTVVLCVSFAAHAAVQSDIKIAVLPFTIHAGDDLSYLEQSFPELLSDRLREAGFTVVDLGEIKKLMTTHGFQTLDPSNARQLAQLSDSGFAVYGFLNQIGENITLDARVIDIAKSHSSKKFSVTQQGLINLLPAVDSLVAKMKADLLRLDVIGQVDVVGTQVLDKDVVLMRLAMQKGDILTAKSVNSALKTIYGLGYFNDVKVRVSDEPEGKKVVFVVQEKPRVQALSVRGAKEIDSEDILEAVSTKKGAVINPKVLADDIRVIRDLYRKEGYYKAKVTHEVKESDGAARLTYIVDEGPELFIEDVVIDGAEQMDPDDIKDVLATSEHGMFSWLTSSGVLKEELLERDGAAIQAFYQNNGFIDVRVGKPQVEIKDDGITVTFQVWEGDRYKMGMTTFKGELIEDTPKLLAVSKIDDLAEDDDFFNRSIIKDDVDALSSYYNDYGYAYADVQVKLNDDPERKVVDVVYNITKHQKVHIRRVLIEGNTATRDNVIMREMRLADGDMFSGAKLKRSTQRLNNLGYFESVDISPVQTGNPEEMDLVVKVKDKATGRVSGGIGYSTYDSVFFAASINEANLFGKGYNLGLNAAFSGRSTAFTLSFKNPRLYDSEWGFGAEVHRRKTEYGDFDRTGIGSTLQLSHPIGEYTHVSFDYTIESYIIDNIDKNASHLIRENKGHHLLSRVSTSITRDTRDSYRFATTGTRMGLTLQYGGGVIGGTDHFIKYMLEHQWWTPVFEEVIFHSKIWAGFVHKNFSDKEIPSDVRIRLGGTNSVRGYSPRKITPLDDKGAAYGGTKAFYINLELKRMLSKEYGVSAMIFADAGNSWQENEAMFSAPFRKGTKPDSLGLYKSVGFGLNWFSPMGPIGFVYGYGLDRIGNSSPHKFELLMGQQF